MLKKKGTFIGAIALTLTVGCGLIFGNAVLASQAMGMRGGLAPIGQDESVYTDQTVTQNEPVYTDQTVTQSGYAEIPRQYNDERSDGYRRSVGMVTNDNGQTIIVEYYFDEGHRTVKANLTAKEADGAIGQRSYFEGKSASGVVARIIGVEDYDDWAIQVGAPTLEEVRAAILAEEEANPLYIPGDPDESYISEETAIANAIKLLKEKYALRQETIDRFTVTALFYIKYEDITEPVWWVNLYPTNRYDFTEIGCYWALINSDTGEAVGLFSAVDGRG